MRLRVKLFARHSPADATVSTTSYSMALRRAGTPAECNVYKTASQTAPHSSGVLCADGARPYHPDGVSTVGALYYKRIMKGHPSHGSLELVETKLP